MDVSHKKVCNLFVADLASELGSLLCYWFMNLDIICHLMVNGEL